MTTAGLIFLCVLGGAFCALVGAAAIFVGVVNAGGGRQ